MIKPYIVRVVGDEYSPPCISYAQQDRFDLQEKRVGTNLDQRVSALDQLEDVPDILVLDDNNRYEEGEDNPTTALIQALKAEDSPFQDTDIVVTMAFPGHKAEYEAAGTTMVHTSDDGTPATFLNDYFSSKLTQAPKPEPVGG